MKKISLLAIMLFFMAATLVAQDHIVTLQNNAFTPQELTINVGQTVLFDNVQGTHNVNGTQTAYPDNPESFGNGAAMPAPWNYEHTFTIAGTYQYKCDPHEVLGMVGTITVTGNANEEVVITEIMYNPPESGADSLEFVEMYNKGTAAVDVSGWYTNGVTFTFPENTMMGAGEYIVLAKNKAALENTLNISGTTVFEWLDSSLSNGGETIELFNVDSISVDMVDYDDGGDWASSADGDGPSLVLCDYDSDNNVGANWIAATTPTGVTINEKEIFANPGAASSCPDNPIISFDNSDITISEDQGDITFGVTLSLFNGNATTVNVVISNASTATAGEDFTFENTILTFNENGTQELTVNIIDDMLEEDTETIILELINPSNDATVNIGTLEISIEDNDTVIENPPYSIEDVTETDENGVGIFVDSLVQIQGIVYGVNMNGNGLQFTIIDEDNDGIGLYYGSDDLGYTVNEGDEVIVNGTIGQYNGLLQIAPQQITLVSSGNTLVEPTLVTELNEETESQLVRMENVTLVDAAAWTNSGSGFNVEVTDGTNTITVRIDADVNIYGMNPPTGTFSVTGIGGQYDNSSPYDSGYQLLPRYVEDINPYNTTPVEETTYPDYSITQVTSINEGGVVDSLNVTCTLTAVVQSIDFRLGDGVQFFMHDGNDGIAVFDSDNTYYEVTPGDEVSIKGEIGQYNGLTQIYPDTIIVNSQANEILDFSSASGLDETTESEPVELLGNFIDPSLWNPTGSGFNIDFQNLAGGITTVRIDDASPLFDYELEPTLYFLLRGYGSQFDNSEPYTEGYQVMAVDLIPYLSTIDPALAEKVNIFPNPTSDYLNIQTEDVTLTKIYVTDMLGRIVKEVNSPSAALDIRLLPQGVYTVTCFTKDAYISKRIVKK